MLVDGYCMREVAGKKGFVLVEYRILHGKIGVVGYVFESELKLGAKLLETQNSLETHPELACQVVVIPPGVLGMIVTEEEIGLLVLNHCLDIEEQTVFLTALSDSEARPLTVLFSPQNAIFEAIFYVFYCNK